MVAARLASHRPRPEAPWQTPHTPAWYNSEGCLHYTEPLNRPAEPCPALAGASGG
jgi:hypothetical protein